MEAQGMSSPGEHNLQDEILAALRNLEARVSRLESHLDLQPEAEGESPLLPSPPKSVKRLWNFRSGRTGLPKPESSGWPVELHSC